MQLPEPSPAIWFVKDTAERREHLHFFACSDVSLDEPRAQTAGLIERAHEAFPADGPALPPSVASIQYVPDRRLAGVGAMTPVAQERRIDASDSPGGGRAQGQPPIVRSDRGRQRQGQFQQGAIHGAHASQHKAAAQERCQRMPGLIRQLRFLPHRNEGVHSGRPSASTTAASQKANCWNRRAAGMPPAVCNPFHFAGRFCRHARRRPDRPGGCANWPLAATFHAAAGQNCRRQRACRRRLPAARSADRRPPLRAGCAASHRCSCRREPAASSPNATGYECSTTDPANRPRLGRWPVRHKRDSRSYVAL